MNETGILIDSKASETIEEILYRMQDIKTQMDIMRKAQEKYESALQDDLSKKVKEYIEDISKNLSEAIEKLKLSLGAQVEALDILKALEKGGLR